MQRRSYIACKVVTKRKPKNIQARQDSNPDLYNTNKVMVRAYTSQKTKQLYAYPGFLGMKHAWEYCYSPLDGMLVHRRATPQQYVPANQFIHLGE